MGTGRIRKKTLGLLLVLIMVCALGLGIAALIAGPLRSQADRSRPIRIGYFHGGRTILFFRAYVNQEFDRAGVKLVLSTRNLHSGSYTAVPKSWSKVHMKMDQVTSSDFGKVTGVELIQDIQDGKLDGAMVGESSFLKAVGLGMDVEAIVLLGHDTMSHPGHCILFRRGVRIRKPSDMKGKVYSSRRAGPGDEVMLLEFLTQNGIDPDQDVTIKPGISDDEQDNGLKDGTYDGGYYHLMDASALVRGGYAYVYRPLNWVRADMCQALLVFKPEFVRAHPDELTNMIKVFTARIQYEMALPRSQRIARRPKGMQMAEDFLGMDFPQCDVPPLVRVDLLTQMQRLLRKHHMIKTSVDLSRYVDNSLVVRAAHEMGIKVDPRWDSASL